MKYFLIELEGQEPVFYLPGKTLGKYSSNPLEEVKKLMESILCLVTEGPEVERPLTIYEAVKKEAFRALAIVEGKP